MEILNYKTINETVNFIKKIVLEINNNEIYKKNNFCEPFLSKANLINNFGTLENIKKNNRKSISDFLAYVDKSHDLTSLKKKIKVKNIKKLAKVLEKNKFISKEL